MDCSVPWVESGNTRGGAAPLATWFGPHEHCKTRHSHHCTATATTQPPLWFAPNLTAEASLSLPELHLTVLCAALHAVLCCAPIL